MSLSTLLPVEIESSGFPIRSVGESRALFGFPFAVVDTQSGQETLLTEDVFVGVHVADDGLGVLRGVGDVLTHVTYDGEVTTLANHAAFGWQITASGHVATLLSVDLHQRGPLGLVAPGSLEERIVDVNVVNRTVSMHEGADGLLLVYAVDDPSRAGVWVAKPDLD